MPTVLIVDDEPAVIQMIGCVLEIRGYEVIGAGNGSEALQKMEEKRPDLVITDLVMPGMNGLDFCRKVKQDDRWESIPVMIVTSATRGTDLADGFWKLGTEAADFVTKPFDPFDMADRVERLLNNGSVDSSDGEES
jgi:CheY-like chemotaxis protein